MMGAGLMRRVQTTLFFPDFPDENATDPVLCVLPPEMRHRLIAVPDGDVDGSRAFRFDLHLRGAPDEDLGTDDEQGEPAGDEQHGGGHRALSQVGPGRSTVSPSWPRAAGYPEPPDAPG